VGRRGRTAPHGSNFIPGKAKETLEARISEEELIAQAEAAEPIEPAEGDERD
jgi:hypothetical protein